MYVLLKSLSHSQIDDIRIDEPLFPIGRNEAPFSNYPPEVTGTLSRRHARLFTEGGCVYIADVGSRNGTRLNAVLLELKPVRVRRGDKISFGGKLEFEVDIVGAAEFTEPAMASLRLTLTPVGEQSLLEPISITQFPFLISKSDSDFARSAVNARKQIDFLSRRHAHIFLRGDKPFLEDLGSTNGTYINGKRLDEHASPIRNGDRIAFGENYLVYTAALQSLKAGTGDAKPEPVPMGNLPSSELDANQPAHTIFVSSANSFLDIFCVQEEDDKEEKVPEAEQEQRPTAAKTAPPKAGIARFIHKLRIFGKELNEAFGEPRKRDPRIGWAIFGAVILINLVVASVFFSNSSLRDIRGAFNDKQFFKSAELANAYLANHPDDKEVRQISTEALMKATVTPWLNSIKQEDFAAAQAALDKATAVSSANAQGQTLLELFSWITRLQRFITERGGPTAPIRMFSHEKIITGLLDWWDADPEAHRRQMYIAADYAPAFKDINALSFSYLRTLRSEKSVYLAAIDTLTATISAKLDDNAIEALAPVLSAFEKQYPRVTGVDQLQTDLKNFIALNAVLESDNVAQANAAMNSKKFATPPFREKVAKMQSRSLPSTAVTAQYEKAETAWRSGQLEATVAILAELAAVPGGDMAARQLPRKQQLLKNFKSLQQARGKDAYASQLLQFYGQLDQKEDRFLIGVVSEDFKRYSAATLKEADSAWQMAQQRWNSYQKAGGIRGLQRLEDRVSPQFKQQAKLLTAAYDNAQRGNDVYQLLKQEIAADRRKLYQQVLAETKLQRRSLQQLSMVLSPTLLSAKLELLGAQIGDEAAQPPAHQ